MAWYFIGVYVINRTLHGCLEIQNFFSLVEKYFTRSNIIHHFRISAQPSNTLYLLRKANYCKELNCPYRLTYPIRVPLRPF